MGFRRRLRIFPPRRRMPRRMARARRGSAAGARHPILAVLLPTRRPRLARRSVHAGRHAMRERARRGDELTQICVERRRAFRWLLLPAAQWMMPNAWADASRLASARLWPAQEYTRVIFESATPIEHQLVVLRDPDRLVLDLARIDRSDDLAALAARVQPADPYIAAIRIGQPAGGFLRIVLDLKSEIRPQAFALKPVAEFGHRLVID